MVTDEFLKSLTFEDIDARRQRIGLNQKELCRVAGVHTQTYTRFKQPGATPPTIPTKARLNEALDLIEEHWRVERLRSLPAFGGRTRPRRPAEAAE